MSIVNVQANIEFTRSILDEFLTRGTSIQNMSEYLKYAFPNETSTFKKLEEFVLDNLSDNNLIELNKFLLYIERALGSYHLNKDDELFKTILLANKMFGTYINTAKLCAVKAVMFQNFYIYILSHGTEDIGNFFNMKFAYDMSSFEYTPITYYAYRDQVKDMIKGACKIINPDVYLMNTGGSRKSKSRKRRTKSKHGIYNRMRTRKF